MWLESLEMQGTSGGPEVKTPRFQRRECGWIPVGRTKILHACAAKPKPTKQKKNPSLITTASSNHTSPPPQALIQDMLSFVTGEFLDSCPSNSAPKFEFFLLTHVLSDCAVFIQSSIY